MFVDLKLSFFSNVGNALAASTSELGAFKPEDACALLSAPSYLCRDNFTLFLTVCSVLLLLFGWKSYRVIVFGLPLALLGLTVATASSPWLMQHLQVESDFQQTVVLTYEIVLAVIGFAIGTFRGRAVVRVLGFLAGFYLFLALWTDAHHKFLDVSDFTACLAGVLVSAMLVSSLTATLEKRLVIPISCGIGAFALHRLLDLSPKFSAIMFAIGMLFQLFFVMQERRMSKLRRSRKQFTAETKEKMVTTDPTGRKTPRRKPKKE